MSSATIQRPTPVPASEPVTATPSVPSSPVVALKRRTIDSILIGFGVLATVVFAIAGGLLTWGNNFSDDYVTKELTSQHITFPDAAALAKEGRNDLAPWAGKKLDTGDGAEAYASYINGHLAKIADGATYADLGTTQRAATAAVKAAVAANQPQASIDKLQGTVDGITAQRN